MTVDSLQCDSLYESVIVFMLVFFTDDYDNPVHLLQRIMPIAEEELQKQMQLGSRQLKEYLITQELEAYLLSCEGYDEAESTNIRKTAVRR